MQNLLNAEQIDFDVVTSQKEKLMLIDFYADWCGPCRALSPVLDKIAEANQEDVIVLKVNVDKNAELARREKYKVTTIPQIFFLKEGEVVSSLKGVQTFEIISDKINNMREIEQA